MNIQQIKTFVWVVKLGGFRKAAEKLHTSQPAVSARISALEKGLGATLLERGAGGVRLTRKGQEFLTYAEQFLRMTDTMQARFASSEELVGNLRLGVSETIVHSWLSRFLADFSGRFPRIDVDIQVDVTTNLRDALLGRAIDLAFLMGPVSEFSVANVDLPDYELAWFCATSLDHSNGIDALACTVPIVTFARTTRPFIELRDYMFEHYGPDIRLFPTSSLSAGFEMIRDGVAIGALPKTLADEFVKRGEIIELTAGWSPPSLPFTASYIADPPNFLAERAAALAAKVAFAWAK